MDDRVIAQYQAFPYPERRPDDERTRLIGTWLDDLGLVAHHCFAGRLPDREPLRILVAGGGTGDGTIFLAEQLKGTGARIVHVDVSAASIEIARARARIRGLGGIEWINESLLELPRLGLGQFDYINCVGVLHHLASPEAGMDALLTSLAPEGALGLMVYAQYGRTGVYQLQDLLKLVAREVQPMNVRLELTREVLATLPRQNWFKRGEELHADHTAGGDPGIVDLLLHSRDRAYTVPQLYEWLEDRAGLHITFSDVHRGRLPYSAEVQLYRGSAALRGQLESLSLRDQHAVAELFHGDLTRHCLFASRLPDAGAHFGDASHVPFFIREEYPASGSQMASIIRRHGAEPFLLTHTQSGLAVPVTGSERIAKIFDDMDGIRPFAEIFASVRSALGETWTDAMYFEHFRPWFDALNLIDRLLLKADPR